MENKDRNYFRDLRPGEDEARNGIVGDQVLTAIGYPADLYCVQVRQLWDNHYRVNIFTGLNVASARIVASYFLQIDETGKIVSSTPRLNAVDLNHKPAKAHVTA